jgi:hypothetical protein
MRPIAGRKKENGGAKKHVFHKSRRFLRLTTVRMKALLSDYPHFWMNEHTAALG